MADLKIKQIYKSHNDQPNHIEHDLQKLEEEVKGIWVSMVESWLGVLKKDKIICRSQQVKDQQSIYELE